MKPLFLLLAMAATAVAQEAQPSAADITAGRVGGDPARTSTSIRIDGNANQGAGVNNLAGETANKTLRIDPEAAVATPSITVTGAASAQPSEPVPVQPMKTSGSTEPSDGATDTGPGAEQ
jgi:hypothetical protein